MPKHLPEYMPLKLQNIIIDNWGDLISAAEITGIAYSRLRSCFFKTEHTKLRTFRAFADCFDYDDDKLFDICCGFDEHDNLFLKENRGEKLKRRMRECGYSNYAEVSRRVGTSIDLVKRFFYAEDAPKQFEAISSYKRFANAAHISLEELADILLS